MAFTVADYILKRLSEQHVDTLFGVPAAFWVNDELFRALPPEVPPPTKPDSYSLPPMPTLPPPGALTESGAEPFTLPPESPGEPPSA